MEGEDWFLTLGGLVCEAHSDSERSPTVFSAFCLVFILHTTFTASCWACIRVGTKSPFLIHSLLSTLGRKVVLLNVFSLYG